MNALAIQISTGLQLILFIVFWAPDEITKDNMIWIHSDLGNDINPECFPTENFIEV